MSIINVPIKYESDYHSISKAGEWISEIGTTVLIIAGKKAYAAVKSKLEKGLVDYHIDWTLTTFAGYPTVKKAKDYVAQAKLFGADVIVGIGGGSVLDIAKFVAQEAGLPVVTIPTVATTCAAWSALSIIYKEDGSQDVYEHLEQSPALIIADKHILRKAPIHYLHAGIADSVAKYYEVVSDYSEHKNNFELRLQIKVCDLLREFLEQDYIASYRKYGSVLPKETIDNAIDSIILLAGLTGSIQGDVPYGGIAHHFYNQSTKLLITNRRLHGEVVLFGLAVQWALEGVSNQYIKTRLQGFKVLGQPITLDDLGIINDKDKKVYTLAKLIKVSKGDYSSAVQPLTTGTIIDAIFLVDELGRQVYSDSVFEKLAV
ncbi:MAG: iron-containing alcohol dehydrogenase family protein [Clostridiales Family XIII bacterium]|jgi:glycerol dehydrogenase|nr:iron-containing alcohol dehydrogenase family protein [Clostridiales Family XIII bacterium]